MDLPEPESPLMMTMRICTSIAECAEHGQAGLAYTINTLFYYPLP